MKLLILKECWKTNLHLDRIENKLNYRRTNNLKETDYKVDFDIDSELAIPVKPGNQPIQSAPNIEVLNDSESKVLTTID